MNAPTVGFAGATIVSVALASAARSSPDACQLLTAKDASTLAGVRVIHTHGGGPYSHNCVYNGAGGPASYGVEITVREFPDAAAAHTAFPRWVLPYAGPAPGLTTAPVPGAGDEATVVRGGAVSGVYFRHGAVLVKVGVHPPVADAALKAAAITVLSRL